MSTTTPQKTNVSAPPATSAFGVTIAAAQPSAAEKPGMSPARKRAIMAVGAIALLAGVSIYMHMPAKEPDPEVADHPAVQQVIEMKQNNDTAGLTQLSKNEDSVVARRAVQALANIGGADAVRDSLTDPRPDVRYMAVTGLGNSGDPGQLDALSDFIQNDPAPDVRIAAVRGVSNIRDFSIFDHLYPALNDPEESVRKAALGAIEDRIGLKFPGYKPDGPGGARAAAVNRIRATIAGMKSVFDRQTNQQSQQKSN